MIKIPTTEDEGWVRWDTQCPQKKHHDGVMGRGCRKGEDGAANTATGKSATLILNSVMAGEEGEMGD